MTELEKIEYAKSFIDKLANGVNPLDNSVIPDGEIVNNVRLSRCFFYVSDILRQVIENGGITPMRKREEKKGKKQSYYLLPEQAEMFEYSETPITATEIVERIVKIGPQEGVRKFPRKNITKWLMSLGFIEEIKLPTGSVMKKPTSFGEDIGISLEERYGQYGAYCVILYSTDAQHFIVDNIEALLAFDVKKFDAKTSTDVSKSNKESNQDNDADNGIDTDEKTSVANKTTVFDAPNAVAEKNEPKVTCGSCRFARSGDCFPQCEICADYEKAYEVPKSERESWPDMGDASYMRQTGKSRK